MNPVAIDKTSASYAGNGDSLMIRTATNNEGVDASLIIARNDDSQNIKVMPSRGAISGAPTWDVYRDNAYLTGGFYQREAAETVANLFRMKGGAAS